MSEGSETLFLFEFLVENIRLERLCRSSGRLALFLRLLDFPPLLIYQPSCGATDHAEQEGTGKPGEYVFNRGKSCVFKMNPDSLLSQLSNAPLHATVLDVSEDRPRLVGSSLISLAKVGGRIKQGGVSDPSSLIETGLSAFCDLAGERIGTISLRYKLVCLGASLLPHIADRRGFKSTGLPGGGHGVEAGNKSPEKLNNEETGSEIPLGEDELDEGENENYCEDLTAFCPPRLYYSNTEQERVRDEEVDLKFLNLQPEAFTYEDLSSEEEEDGGPSSHQKVAFSSKPVNQEAVGVTPGVTPNTLREALKQLPLLNALVAELSLLTDSVRPRNCSTPNPPAVKEEASVGNRSASKPHRKKLVYGTTKAFRLRLRHVSPLEVKRRECSSSTHRELKPSVTGRTKREPVKSSGRTSGLNQSHGLGEDSETALQRVTPEQKARHDELNAHARGGLLKESRPRRETECVRLTRVDRGERRSDQSESEFHHDGFKFLQKGNRSSGSSVDGKEGGDDGDYRKDDGDYRKDDGDYRKDDGDYRKDDGDYGKDDGDYRKDDGDYRKDDGDYRKDDGDYRKDDGDYGKDDGDYADDFDSLESSDASLPGSPESSRSRAAKPVPVPVKSPSSPHRALRGTHVIRPRTPSSTPGSSVERDDGDGSPSLRTVRSREPTPAGDRAERNSSAASFLSSQGERTESPRDRGSVQGFSDKSISSFEAQEAEEMEDELGSLGFRQKYQHISELVAPRLPGYTM